MTGEKYIDVDGIKTRYFDKGSGPVVVLFHGGHFGFHDAADCAEDWSLNFDGLSERFHVFAVDKIGQGFTDNPKRDEDYTSARAISRTENIPRNSMKCCVASSSETGDDSGSCSATQKTKKVYKQQKSDPSSE